MLNDKQEEDLLYDLISSIQARTEFDHPVEKYRLIETHISYVLLTGPFAYKFKKPLDLGFLDFRTLEKRKYYCEEEIRLNRRLAPDLYRDVVAFCGSPEQPVLNGSGPVLEYAVRMEQFAEDEQALNLLHQGKLTGAHMEQLAWQLADFHQNVSVAQPDSEYGTSRQIRQYAMDNFSALRPMLEGDGRYSKILENLSSWTSTMVEKLDDEFTVRKQNGFIRECHGDVHLGNIVRHRNKMLIFDCVEFSRALHWIDVINDLAFLIMDLDEHNQAAMAQRLLNAYLQYTGDYAGLNLLRFYLVYRALIRSKVAGIRLGQSHLEVGESEQEAGNEHRYLKLASRYTRPAAPVLIITHGISGSGKSTLSQELAENIEAIWIRSDIERKRLYGLRAQDRSRSGLRTGIYDPTSSARTYRRLVDLSRLVLTAGYPVIVDATFLQKHTRKIFYRIAAEFKLPFVILDFQAQEALLKARVDQRCKRADDASEADIRVLEEQLRCQDPLDELETEHSIKIDAAGDIVIGEVVEAVVRLKKKKLKGNLPDHGTG